LLSNESTTASRHAPELALRKELHRHGSAVLHASAAASNLRRQADVVFPRVRVAVFVDGCFWHGCPEHGVRPTTTNWYWQEKIARNGARDTDTDRRLTEGGWMAIRVWEHESTTQAATDHPPTVTERGFKGSPIDGQRLDCDWGCEHNIADRFPHLEGFLFE